jgi:hypothetical protein
MPQQALRRQHGDLRMRGGPGRRAQDGDGIALRRIDETIVELGLARRALAALDGEVGGRDQARVGIFPHAARVRIDDVLQVRHPLAQADELLHLLLVLGKDDPGAGRGEQIGHLLVERVAIHAQTHGADRVGCDLARHPIRPVVADQRDHIALPHSDLDKPEREVAHPRLIVAPGEFAPDAQVLLAESDLRRVLARIKPQQLRQGVGAGGARGIIHHTCAPA